MNWARKNRILTFSQEFGGTALDPMLRTVIWDWVRTLSGNNEGEYYCDPNTPAASSGTPNINPFAFTGNSLIITAAPSIDLSNTTGTRGLPYSSGLVSTWNSFAQRFGRWEMRARFAKSGTGRGFWPAFWLLPKSKQWTTEIDICELFLGPNIAGEGGPSAVHTGLVAQSPNGSHHGIGTQWNNIGPASYEDGAFHVFWLEWDSLHLVWGIDDTTLNTIRTPYPFAEEMFPIANLAVGQAGAWPNAPETGATATMELDYIRAFSDAPDAVPVPWGGTSSPDGVNTAPVGAIAANGPVKIGTGSITVRVAAHITPTSLGPATFDLLVDGVAVATGLKTAASYDATPPTWDTITVSGVAIDGARAVGVRFTDSFWSPGPPPWNRVLVVGGLSLVDTPDNYTAAVDGTNLVLPHAEGVTIQADNSVRMGSNGIATFSLP